MQRAIVTGGCGFIGSYVVAELRRAGYNVVIIDNLSQGKEVAIDKSVTFIKADIRDIKEIQDHINEGDIIFHMAALTSVSESILNPYPYHQTNIMGTYNVYEVARIKKAKGIIFSSSASVYGSQEGALDEELSLHPESPYAFQKMFGELLGAQYHRNYQLPVISLRYFNVYGEGNHEEGSYAPVTARFLKAKREGKLLQVVGDGKQTRDYIHAKDVARANVLAIELINKNMNEVINVSTGIPTSVLDIAMKVGGDIEHLPPRIEPRYSCGSTQKAQDILKFNPSVDFNQGLKDLLQP